MSNSLRSTLIAMTSVAILLVAPIAAAQAQQTVDTSQLPRVAGAVEIYASPAQTIFTTLDSVGATSESVANALAAQGWRQYASLYTEAAKDPNQTTMKFKKGPQGLSVFIGIAPAQKNATGVNYSIVPIPIDVPIPNDATQIQFDPIIPKLVYKTAATIDSTLNFYRHELVAQYWSPWSTVEGRRVASAETRTKKFGHAVYVHGAYRPLELVIQLEDDGQLKVTVFCFAAENLVAMGPPRKSAEVKPVETSKSGPKTVAEAEKLSESIMKKVDDALAKAKAGIKSPPRGGPVALLAPLAGNTAPIPLPQTAEAIVFDEANRALEFTSASTVKQVADFYRSAMTPLGWKEQRAVVNQDNLVVLDFLKGYDQLGIKIFAVSQGIKVQANGDALGAPVAAPPPLTAADLESDDVSGLPVPKQRTLSVGNSGPFRAGVEANVPVALEVVLGFYRRELGQRGWQEIKADSKSDRADISYMTAEGPAVLGLGRNKNETTIRLVVRKQIEASKSGLMARAGQTRILLGNITDLDATITIDAKTIKIPAGAGAKAPDGPSIEVKPGKYSYASKAAAKPVKNDELVVGPDEIWGIMIGPGGSLVLQMY